MIMLGEILEIRNNIIILKKNSNISNDIINFYVKITDKNNLFVGEIITFNKDNISIKIIGEIINNKFIYGVSSRPSISGIVELLNDEEVKILFNLNNYNPKKYLYLGKSALYKNYPIYADLNNLFASHLVILGNTGSGKSCGTARIYQNLFYQKDKYYFMI